MEIFVYYEFQLNRYFHSDELLGLSSVVVEHFKQFTHFVGAALAPAPTDLIDDDEASRREKGGKRR